MIEVCPQDQKQLVLDYLDRRFGITPAVFSDYAFYAGPTGRVFIGPKETFDVHLTETTGILLARIGKGVKPSSLLFQVFGRHVIRNCVDLSQEQARRYFRGEAIELFPRSVVGATNGFVMLQYAGQPLACGLLRDTLVDNVLPKEMRMDVSYL